MAERRLLWVLIDGIGDVALPQLEYLTPLQKANIPNMDLLSSNNLFFLLLLLFLFTISFKVQHLNYLEKKKSKKKRKMHFTEN